MPLIFSYGTLQHEEVQLSTIGRRLDGHRDALPRYEQSRVKIEDPHVAAELGETHHINVVFNGRDDSSVAGMVFEITDAELAQFDVYEAEAKYTRVIVTLASGKRAWVYRHD